MKPLSIQPIPYQGSKRSLAPRICSLFPSGVTTLYEPFAGSAALTLYAASQDLAEEFVIGDIFGPLIDLWEMIVNQPGELADRYNDIWRAQFEVGDHHFNDVRAAYNEEPNPVQLLYLIARCVKNAVRFNKQGRFSQSVDKRRTGMSPDRVARTAHVASQLLKGRVRFFKGDFAQCIGGASSQDLIYMDPPYQGTTYGRDKRYAMQLCRNRLIEALHFLDQRGIAYVLSYDGRTGEKTYGAPLPKTVKAKSLEIPAGRSSQATLNGRKDITIESLYVSHIMKLRDVLMGGVEPQLALL